MSHSHRLRLRDIREIHHLVSRIAEFGDQADVWRRIALEGLLKLLGGSVALTVDFRTSPDGHPVMIDPLDEGFESPQVRRKYEEYLAQGLAVDASFQRLRVLQSNGSFVTITRHELIDDQSWYACPTVSEARRMANVNDFVVTTLKVGFGSVEGFIVYRPWKGQPFDARQRRLLRLFHIALAHVFRESNIPQLTVGRLPHLSPRLKQTLQLMLTDRSLKEIAGEMNLSRHTINAYQKALYERLAVNSRAGLMARFRPMKKGICLPAGLV